jgi:hypothetical protein
MKKLVWSAFALSLIIVSRIAFPQTEAVDDFLGLETEVLPDLTGPQRFTSENFNQKDSWKVSAEETIKELPAPLKGQTFSIIPWSDLDPHEFLSIEKWLGERDLKDTIPDWKVRLRQASHSELVGKILQCRGVCYSYRGVNKARVQHLSRVLEGDEIQTEKNSVAWVFTMDGGLLRLSPQTSVSFHEINIGSTQMVILARLNTGHVHWRPQLPYPELLDDAPETDSFSLPLLVREANQEYYERQINRGLSPEKRLSEIVNMQTLASEEQVTTINNLKAESAELLKINRLLVLVSPNLTLISRDESFDLVHLTGGVSWFKKRTKESLGRLQLQLRGYLATDLKPIEDLDWYEVEQSGRSFSKLAESRAELQILELLTKRIKTIELARQFWLKYFTLPVLRKISEPEFVARTFGYNVWGVNLDQRLNFLLEYTRRVETTNLSSIENLMLKFEENGKKIRPELSNNFFQASLNHYLLGLKSRYDKKRLRVREMNDLQYYVWILRNGKF